MTGEQLASIIDHTILKADALPSDVEKLCAEAREWKFASVCVNSSYAELAAKSLAGSGVKICVVVGFPLGAMSTPAKAFEARDAVRAGAQEVDMVLHIGRLKAKDDNYVKNDIAEVKRALEGKAILKVILENCLLTDEEKERACLLAKSAGADFVKTSTGFSAAGATAEDVALMRRVVGPELGVKASGGIRTRADAEAVIAAGATRIGASASVAICRH